MPSPDLDGSQTASVDSASSTPVASIAPTLEPIEAPRQQRELEIITVIQRDGISAILDPTILTNAQAQERYNPKELVLGVSINGDSRAHSIPFLSRHEIVNDVVGGMPLTITW